MGLATDTLAAFWNRLKADDWYASSGLDKGTLFTFSNFTIPPDTILKRLQVTPAICPVLAIAPAPDGHHWRPAKRRRGEGIEDRAAFLVEMATADNDARKIVALAEGFKEFVEAQQTRDNFGIPLLADIEWSKLAYAPRYELKDQQLTGHIEMWQFTGTMTCHFRIV
jgi:hypothetical protein